MKKLLLFILSFSVSFCNAQNYQCLQKGVIPYYTNGNGYLRGMRIDSVTASGSDSVYYPYHTPRGNYVLSALDSTGGSWLGKKVIRQSDGTFLFDNMWEDTVVIKTQANLGDTWTFYKYSTDSIYKATVTAIDTMTVLGIIDSVKKITIEADTNGVMNASDPVNNFQIILSKNHGFVQVFDLYTFPYRLSNDSVLGFSSLDYYLDLVLGDLVSLGDGISGGGHQVTTANSIFHIIPFHNPTQMELYNFSAGEVLESKEQEAYPFNEVYITTIALDTVLSKNISPASVSYNSTSGIGSMQTSYVMGGAPVINYTFSTGTPFGSFDTTKLIDTRLMPEEWNAPYFYHFFQKANYNSPAACPDTAFIVDVNNISYTSGMVEFETLLPQFVGTGPDPSHIGNSTKIYSIGYGQSGYSYNNYTNDYSATTSYIYVDNNGSTCGTYSPPLSVKQVNALTTHIDVFPNPTHDLLNISASGIIDKIGITNLVGQTVYTNQYNSQQVQIDIANLPPGMYFVNINSSHVTKIIKQ